MPPPARRAPSTIGSLSGMIIRALDARGVDGRQVARAAGIDPDRAQAPDARVLRAAHTRLWHLAVEATGDPCFGLDAARFATQTTFHGLGYAVLASATLREAFERIIRYRRLIGDIVELSLQDVGERTRFVIDVSTPPGVPYEAIDAFTAICVRQVRLLRGVRNFNPLAVMLERPEPFPSEPFRQVFRAPVAFSQPQNVLEYSRRALDEPLPAANAELARTNDQVVVAYLARLEQAHVSSRVQAALVQALPDGRPSKLAIARQLGISPRNLQRHLSEEGTSYKVLLDDARIALACNYVREGRLNVTEIAFVLGFAETSTFSRAFKRWTGRSPREYAAKRTRLS
jgi:AraC-like DNA-binding protein